MRILYHCHEYNSPHGGSTHAREFLRALQETNDISADLYPTPRPRLYGTDITEKKNRLEFLPSRYQRLIRLCRHNSRHRQILKPVLHNKHYDAIVYRTDLNISLPKLLKQLSPHSILCLECNAFYFKETPVAILPQLLLQRMELSQYQHADCISVVSNHLRQSLIEKGIPGSIIQVNPNGVNPRVFHRQPGVSSQDLRRQFGIPADAYVLGYVGGMESFRRLDRVLNTFITLLQKGHRHLFLVLVGDGEDMPSLRSKIDRYSHLLNGAIACMGRKPYSQIPHIMQTFDIALFPFSNPYGSPQKLFEYLAMRLPTIGPDVPAVREVFEDHTHLRLASQTGSDLEHLILGMQDSPDQAQQMARRGQQHVLSSFTWQENARRVVQLIQKVSTQRNSDALYPIGTAGQGALT